MLTVERDAAKHVSNAYDEWASLGHQFENSTFPKALVTYSEWDKYRTTNEGFLLYSVGDNGIDDGGDFRPRHDEFLGLDLSLARRLIVPVPDAIQ